MRTNRFFSLALLPVAALSIAWRSDVEPLSKEFKAQTIDSLVTAMKEEYVFPDVAVQVDKDLRERLAKGEYDKVESGAEFSKLLTDQMNAVCKDAHLRVRFSKEDLPKRERRGEPSKEEIAAFEKRVRLMNGGIISADRFVGNVGYIDTTNFMPLEQSKRAIVAAMAMVEETDALIIDMRYNGGGDPSTVQFFCSYFFDSKPVHLNSLQMRGKARPDEFWTLKSLPGKRYLNKDVYVLCSKRTGSAAEEFCYNLKNLRRITLIGENTWGGADPGGVVRLNDHFSVFLPHGRAINPITKTNWEGTGVDPDIRRAPAEALKYAHVMAIKRLITKADSDEDKARLADALKAAEKGETK